MITAKYLDQSQIHKENLYLQRMLDLAHRLRLVDYQNSSKEPLYKYMMSAALVAKWASTRIALDLYSNFK